jgi:hypothetical protein
LRDWGLCGILAVFQDEDTSGDRRMAGMKATMKWDELTPNERLVAEQAVMNLRALNDACDAAADGTVLAIAEQLAVKQGREAIRRTLELSLQSQDAAIEKKARRAGPAAAD